RRLAGAVAAEQRHDFVLAHVERDGVEDVALAVEGVDLVDYQERGRPRRRDPRLGGERGDTRADIDLAHLGVAARVLDRAVNEHLALLAARGVVGDREAGADVVFDQQRGNFGGDRRRERGDARARGGGEPGGRLVEQQDSRRGRKGEPHVERALPAIGKRG